MLTVADHCHTQVAHVYIQPLSCIMMVLRCIKNSSFSVTCSLNLTLSLLPRMWIVARFAHVYVITTMLVPELPCQSVLQLWCWVWLVTLHALLSDGHSHRNLKSCLQLPLSAIPLPMLPQLLRYAYIWIVNMIWVFFPRWLAPQQSGKAEVQ